MIAELKTVTRLIDATAFENKGQAVAIRYVKEDGEIKEMLVSKPVKTSRKSRREGTTTRKTIAPTRKEQAMLLVCDHTDSGRYKNLFMFAIVAFNPDGKLGGPWHTIKRGT